MAIYAWSIAASHCKANCLCFELWITVKLGTTAPNPHNFVHVKAGVSIARQLTQRFASLVWLAAIPLSLPAQSGFAAPFQTAAQIRQLSPAEAARNYPVHLRGVVTY